MIQAIINGPPGSGKTTLGKMLQDQLGVIHVATGELLRDNIKQKTPLGTQAKEYITSKSIIPDHIVIEMIHDRIVKPDCQRHGFVLDGFPRTVDQALALERQQIEIQQLLLLELPPEKIEARITGRRVDPVSGQIYHQSMKLPVKPEIRRRLKQVRFIFSTS